MNVSVQNQTQVNLCFPIKVKKLPKGSFILKGAFLYLPEKKAELLSERIALPRFTHGR